MHLFAETVIIIIKQTAEIHMFEICADVRGAASTKRAASTKPCCKKKIMQKTIPADEVQQRGMAKLGSKICLNSDS